MPKTAMIRARTEPALKKEAESVFKKLGLTSTEAINLFYTQVKLHKGLPFEVKVPNETTIRTFEKTDRGEDIAQCKDADDMFKKLGVYSPS
jgi:DNA-damage-inducible protein J